MIENSHHRNLKMNPIALQYTVGFGICGVLALVAVTKFTKPTDERVAELNTIYARRAAAADQAAEQAKMQAFLNNLKKGKADVEQERVYRRLLSRGSDATTRESRKTSAAADLTGAISAVQTPMKQQNAVEAKDASGKHRKDTVAEGERNM